MQVITGEWCVQQSRGEEVESSQGGTKVTKREVRGDKKGSEIGAGVGCSQGGNVEPIQETVARQGELQLHKRFTGATLMS